MILSYIFVFREFTDGNILRPPNAAAAVVVHPAVMTATTLTIDVEDAIAAPAARTIAAAVTILAPATKAATNALQVSNLYFSFMIQKPSS